MYLFFVSDDLHNKKESKILELAVLAKTIYTLKSEKSEKSDENEKLASRIESLSKDKGNFNLISDSKMSNLSLSSLNK